MATATFNKINQFVEDVSKGLHNLSTGVITLALCPAGSPPLSTNTVLANLTQISYANLSARVVTTTSAVQTAGVLKLILQDLVLTASGAVAPFQYVALYNDTAAADNLIGWYDYGVPITLNNLETLTCDFDGTNGVLQLG